MTTKLEQAARQALGALEMAVSETLDYIQKNHLCGAENNHWIVQSKKAITTLREALAEQAEQSSVAATPTTLAEPVAWWHPKMGAYDNNYFDAMQPLYLSPVRTKDLTDDELCDVIRKADVTSALELYRAVIAADRAKNNLCDSANAEEKNK